MSLHLPVGFLSLAIAGFLGAQVGAAKQGSKTMQWQLENLDKQLVQLKDSKDKMAQLLADRAPIAEQSTQVKEKYTNLFNEILDLAKTDPDAARIVEKWQIQRRTPPSQAAEGAVTAPAANP